MQSIRTKRGLWIILAFFAIIIGLYPIIYFSIDRTFGLLSTKSAELLSNTFWNIGFYAHIVLGGVALLIGWIQFSSKIRIKNITWHRGIGKVYVIAALISSIAGIGIGFFATGGVLASLGFIFLGVSWLYSTLIAFLTIRKGQIEQHQRMMIYSYALCFSAVTLRIWLPILVIIFQNFITAYIIVAWLCWVPNLTVAYFMNKRFTSAAH